MKEPPPTADLSPETAWAPYRPGTQNPWDAIRAGHLLRRAGCGPNPQELRRAIDDGPEMTIDRLLRGDGGADAFNATIDGYEAQGPNARPIDELRGWWLRRMIETPHPLLERMTLFWHGWFAVSHARVALPRVTLDHVRMLRAHALGDFDAMLAAAVRDPAVLLNFAGAENFRAKPNDHLARQLLSRITVGEGEFSNDDAKGTARAFTGLFVRGGALRAIPREHDAGPKTLLGQTGDWSDRDFARIAAAHPSTARRVTRALYRFLVAEEGDPPGALLEPLSNAFAKGRNILGIIATILRSNIFFSPIAYRRRIKGPVEFAVGLCRAFEKTVPTLQLGRTLADLGQDLYHPPTVKGWVGGPAWISRQTIAGRINLARSLFQGIAGPETRLDPAATLARYPPGANTSIAGRLLHLLLQGDMPDPIRLVPATGEAAAIAAAIASLPEYQMS